MPRPSCPLQHGELLNLPAAYGALLISAVCGHSATSGNKALKLMDAYLSWHRAALDVFLTEGLQGS